MSGRPAASDGRVLLVGVTGHRPNRMPARHVPRIVADLTAVMTGIQTSHPGRRCVLASGLAEGADRLAAFAALGLGWRLRALLAFHRTRFEQDFPSKVATGEFRALLEAASAVEEPRKGWDRGRPAEDGYDRVGARLLALSEILIAVWDGEGSHGRGGTAEVIEAARARGIPVVWVHAAKAQAPKVLRPKGAGKKKAGQGRRAGGRGHGKR